MDESKDISDYSSYDRYLQEWIPPIHPKSEEDLIPLGKREFHETRNEIFEEDEAILEEHFGELEPLSLSETIDIISHIV